MDDIVRQYFQSIINDNPHLPPEVAIQATIKKFKAFQDQAARYLDGSLMDRLTGVASTHAAIDEIQEENAGKELMRQVKCKKGCAHCCKMKVLVGLAEAQYLFHYCKEYNIPIDVEYIREQAKLKKDHDYNFSPHRRCVFLSKDETCSVYKARPSACRRYLVVTDPSHCDIVSHGVDKVASIMDLETDMLALGLMDADTERGSLPEMLLKAIELDNAKK